MIQKLCALLLTGMLLLSTSTAVSAAIIVNATQIPVNDGTALKDVPRSHYAYEAITALRDKEILLYYPDFTLHPNEPILIEEVAIMLNKILGNERDIEALYDRAIDYPDPKEGIPSSLLKQIPKHILAKGHLFNAKNNYYYFTHEHFQKVLHEIASIFNVSHDTKQKMLAYKNPNLDTKYVSNAEAAKALYPLFLEKAPNFDYKSYYGENMFYKIESIPGQISYANYRSCMNTKPLFDSEGIEEKILCFHPYMEPKLVIMEPTNNGQLSNVFSDLPISHWAYEQVMGAFETGVINGDGNGQFNPNDIVSEAAFIKIALITLDNQFMANMKAPKHWADPYYEEMKNKDINTISYDSITKRNEKMTRGYAMQIVAELVSGQAMNVQDAIDYGFAHNLTNGKYSNHGSNYDNFAPDEYLTRAEAVVFMQRVVEGLNRNF